MTTKTKLFALVTSLSAANVALRFVLAGGPPNVKPVTFLVIIAGVVGGPMAGFSVGWLSVAISDLASPFGAGVWTIETSASMAMVGLIAGFVWGKSQYFNRWKMAVGGFLLTALFDIGTSVGIAVLYSYPWASAVLALYVPFISGGPTAYPFGLAHELTTAVLLGTIGPLLIRRIKKIY